MKTRLGLILFMLILFIGLNLCEKPDETRALLKLKGNYIIENPLTYGSVTDIDGNIYSTIQIGTHTWMAENLRTTNYNNGDPITLVNFNPDDLGYIDLGKEEYYCWYDNDLKYKETYGAIYNWLAVETGKLCPSGWHVPTFSEWSTFIGLLGGLVEPHDEMIELIRIHWGICLNGFKPSSSGELTPEGFLKNEGCWWTATQLKGSAYLLNFNYFRREPQHYGCSVRCLKD